MSPRESEAIAAISLMAALADGAKAGAERERVKDVFDSFEDASPAQIYQRVVLNRTTLEDEAAALASLEARTLAWEMAVGVCDADGGTNDAERAFLARLQRALGLSDAQASPALADAEALAAGAPPAAPAATPERSASGPAATAAGLALSSAVATATGAASPPAPAAAEREADAIILRHALIAGGLELLPQNLATMAIVPLQMRVVYLVGVQYGHALDQGHIREFLATVGVGMTSQVLEGYARKALGKFAKKLGGKGAGKLAGVATGAAMSFATTWALGQAAKQYYAGGRRLSAVDLQALYAREVERGRTLYAERQGDVQAQARTLDLGGLMNMVRGR